MFAKTEHDHCAFSENSMGKEGFQKHLQMPLCISVYGPLIVSVIAQDILFHLRF